MKGMENTKKLPYEAPQVTVVGSVADLTNAALIFTSTDGVTTSGNQVGGISR
jgi:hypothetical protein